MTGIEYHFTFKTCFILGVLDSEIPENIEKSGISRINNKFIKIILHGNTTT